MQPNLTALTTPPAPPRPASLGDHAAGAAAAAVATVVGAVLMPFAALAWVALSPLLGIGIAIRAASRRGGPAPVAGAHRAAA